VRHEPTHSWPQFEPQETTVLLLQMLRLDQLVQHERSCEKLAQRSPLRQRQLLQQQLLRALHLQIEFALALTEALL
jgi:hypothetical protein